MTLIELGMNITASIAASLLVMQNVSRLWDADRERMKRTFEDLIDQIKHERRAFEDLIKHEQIKPQLKQTELNGAPYRSIGTVGTFNSPDAVEALATQIKCSKCNSDRLSFKVFYQETTDRLHVQCGTKLTSVNEYVGGCGAKWIELPTNRIVK